MKKNKGPAGKIPLRMTKHIRNLGLSGPDQYQGWCEDNGFAFGFKKSLAELDGEIDFHKKTQQTQRKVRNLDRNPKQFIIDACEGKLDLSIVKRPAWKEFFEYIANSNPKPECRESLKGLLLTVHKVAGFLTGTLTLSNRPAPYIKALIQINNRKGQWIRPLKEWVPGGHNIRDQYSSLVNHLFGRYFIPRFMDLVWFRDDEGSYQYRNWYIHLGQGRNIRTAKTPIKITKKIAHHFMQAPRDYSVEEALKYGEILAMDGNIRLVEAILGTAIRNTFSNNVFWTSVYRFFIRNPFIDKRNIGPIVDYINHRKFLEEERLVGPGQVERVKPPQPNFSMRGRDPNALLRHVAKWHDGLAKTSAAGNLFFRRSGIKEFTKGSKKKWRIVELLSGRELIDEGKRMRHCVATYANSCATGKCSIWSLRTFEEEELHHLLTIEVAGNGTITECRGKFNRYPTAGEIAILKEWAAQERLVIQDYVYGYGAR